MHGPPAVSCQVKRSAWHLGVIVVFIVLASAGLISSLALRAIGELGWPLVMCFAAIAFSASIAYSGWQNTPSHRLQWDGQFWIWPPFEPVPIQAIYIAIDFQNLLVVRISGQQKSQWLWLERSGAAINWRALRRAMVFTAGRSASQSPIPADGMQDGVL